MERYVGESILDKKIREKGFEEIKFLIKFYFDGKVFGGKVTHGKIFFEK